jgi:VanZ family protein
LWAPVLAYMAGIFVVSGLPDPPVPGDVPDVNLHAVAYFGLMVLTTRAIAGGLWHGVTIAAIVSAWIITVAYGMSDEWHQSFVPNRHAEWRDVGADAIGAFGAAIALGAWSIIRRL